MVRGNGGGDWNVHWCTCTIGCALGALLAPACAGPPGLGVAGHGSGTAAPSHGGADGIEATALPLAGMGATLPLVAGARAGALSLASAGAALPLLAMAQGHLCCTAMLSGFRAWAPLLAGVPSAAPSLAGAGVGR